MTIHPTPNTTITQAADGGLVVLSPKGVVYRGNRSAAVMWAALTAVAGDPRVAADCVARRFGAPLRQVRADLDRFVAALQGAGAVRVAQ